MARCILSFVISLSQLSGEQAWVLIVFIASQIVLVYFMREVWRRCDF